MMDSWHDFQCHVSHLECSATGERYAAGKQHNLSAADKPLIVRYDLQAVARSVEKASLASRPRDLWRYRELLPLRSASDMVSIGEQFTPLISLIDHFIAEGFAGASGLISFLNVL